MWQLGSGNFQWSGVSVVNKKNETESLLSCLLSTFRSLRLLPDKLLTLQLILINQGPLLCTFNSPAFIEISVSVLALMQRF